MRNDPMKREREICLCSASAFSLYQAGLWGPTIRKPRSYDNARISLKAQGARQWDLYNDAQNNFRIRNVELFDLVFISQASFSVTNFGYFGSSLSVSDQTRLGREVPAPLTSRSRGRSGLPLN